MIAIIRKWGNSLGVRIPKPIAQDSFMREGSSVDIRVQDGRIILEPQGGREYRLQALLKAVSEKNIHNETDTGSAIGREAW